MIQAGDVNLLNATLDAEIRLGVLEKAFDFILANNYSLSKPSQNDIENFRKQSLAELQKKYPNMGIQAK
jgi:hypothetical protein